MSDAPRAGKTQGQLKCRYHLKCCCSSSFQTELDELSSFGHRGAEHKSWKSIRPVVHVKNSWREVEAYVASGNGVCSRLKQCVHTSGFCLTRRSLWACRKFTVQHGAWAWDLVPALHVAASVKLVCQSIPKHRVFGMKMFLGQFLFKISKWGIKSFFKSVCHFFLFDQPLKMTFFK